MMAGSRACGLAAIAVGAVAGLLSVPAAAQPRDVVVSREDCRTVVAHVPANDVAYQPGVDALGRPVVPADLGGGPVFTLPDPLVIRLDVELADRFGLSANPGDVEPQLTAGFIAISGDQVVINGQPLLSEEELALQAACSRALDGR